MSAPTPPQLRATIHFQQQATVTFHAGQLWPAPGSFARYTTDLAAFAEEVTRRFQTDGFIGYTPGQDGITVVPFAHVRRVDFNEST